MPLYKNMVNFSDIALGIVSKNERTVRHTEYGHFVHGLKHQFHSFIKHGNQIKEILEQELVVMQGLNRENYKHAIQSLLDLWHHEKTETRKMRHEAHKICRLYSHCLEKMRKTYEAVLSSTIRTRQYARDHKEALQWAYHTSLAVSALALFVGIDIGHIPKYMKYINQMLESI
jgi:hypothetical protein